MPRPHGVIAAMAGEGIVNLANQYAQRKQTEREQSRVRDLLKRLESASDAEKVSIYGELDPKLALGFEIANEKNKVKREGQQIVSEAYQEAGLGQAPQTTQNVSPQGTASQPAFSINGPSMAARNETKPNFNINQNAQQDPVAVAPQGASVAPAPQQEQPLTPRQRAQAIRARAGQVAAINPAAAQGLLQEARAIEKEGNEVANRALEIHKSEKKAYDDLEAESQQAKKTSRARQTMIEQLATGKLNPKNAKNLLANLFKGSPTLEGLFTTPEREVFKSAGITQFEGMKDIFGVRLSDADLAIASTKVMDPAKPVEANLAIARYWDFSDKMKIQEANIAREVKKENGGFLPINWREQVHERMQERFGDEAQKVTEEAATEGGSRPFKIVEGKIAIVAPDGKRRLIPQEQLKQALLSGGIPE